MFDFTIYIYIRLLNTLQKKRYGFFTFRDYMEKSMAGLLPETPFVILRHDVDARNKKSLYFARLQKSLHIRGSYYFRVVPQSYSPEIILNLADMGHEIGYHYETMDTCHGNIDKAYEEFCINLDMFRQVVPVSTICMHGSPRSNFDNKDIWKKFNYKELGITGEPYFDLDFKSVFYITDTGRRWDGHSFSVRDKINIPTHFTGLTYHSTLDVINALEEGTFPKQVMFTFHPQRWTNNPGEWITELIFQNTKNIIKKHLIIK